MGKAIDISGQRFGKLVAVRSVGSIRTGTLWLCKCDCGKEYTATAALLRFKKSTISCGCKKKRSGGYSSTPEYWAWNHMIQRCRIGSRDEKNYGDRGIAVCDRWVSSIFDFISDMGPRPSSLHSIDRIDNNLGYYKDNCRWATKSEQARNRRTNRIITIDGRAQCLAKWAEEYGVEQYVILNRLKRGWSDKMAVSAPLGSRKK